MTGKITGALREQSDWAQQDEHRLGFIKNKPFYDNRKTAEINFTFEGNLEGHTYYALADSYMFVKVSELAPTIEEASKGMVYATMSSGQVIPQPIARFEENAGGISEEEGYTFLQGQFLVLYKPKTISTVTMPAGIYMVYDRSNPDGIVKISVHIPFVTVGELKTIDPKFLPESAWTEFIDLTQYTDENGTNVADKLLSTFMACIQSGTSYAHEVMSGGNILELCELLKVKKDLVVSIPYNTIVINAKEINYNTHNGEMYARVFNIVHLDNNSITFIVAGLVPTPDGLQFDLWLK